MIWRSTEDLNTNEQLTVEEIERASDSIAGIVRRTSMERSRWLSRELARDVRLKLECFQATGSFKIRGAMARLSRLTDQERSRGVLTVSAGNHGAALAHCAEALGLDATIVVPRSASRAKVEAISRYRIKLVERGNSYDEAERIARAMERESRAIFVSPYNDRDVIAGQGTIALEMLGDAPHLEAMVVPVGGGGLIAGVLVAAKAMKPKMKVYGVEPAASPTMSKALEAGRIIEIEEEETIADGLAGNIEPGSITFPIIQSLIDDIILVSENSIRKAILRVAREDHLMIEGAAASGIAALSDSRLEGYSVATIITGRNISLDLFRSVVESH